MCQLDDDAMLQYVDDLLISLSKEASNKNTILTLNSLAERGYKVSQNKAQISKSSVIILDLNYLKDKKPCSQTGGKP